MENKNTIKHSFSNLAIEPIQKFYNYIRLNFEKTCNDFLIKKIKDNNFEIEKVDKIEKEILQNKQQLQDAYQQLQIPKNRFITIIIGISFFVIIGIFFISVFLKSLGKLKEYKKIKKNIENSNKQLQDKVFKLNMTAFGIFDAMNFLKEYLENKGVIDFKILDDDSINEDVKKYFQQSIFDKKNNKSIVQIKGVECKIRANPYYDILVRELEIQNVITRESKSFPYTVTENYRNSDGKNEVRLVTKYETLTATHNEPTPFLIDNNIMMLKTNFEPSLSFFTNSKKNKDVVKFENKEFSDKFRINSSSNHVALNSFFSIKAQEDYLNWTLEKGYFYNFCKLDKYLIIDFTKVNNINNYENINFLNNLSSSKKSITDLINKNNKQNVNDIKKIAINSLSEYIDKFSQAALMFLFSPMISREFYREKGNYLILDNIETKLKEMSAFDNNNIISINSLISKFSDEVYFRFNTKKRDKPFWLESQDFVKLNSPNLYQINLTLNSYWSETKIDVVPVYGHHVGAQVISVPYTTFHDLKESKEIIYLKHKNNMKTKILIGNKQEADNTYFEDNIDVKFLLDNNVWINDHASLTKNPESYNKFKNVVTTFNETVRNIKANEVFDNDYRIYIDKDGVYLTYNKKIKEDIKNDLTKILTSLSQLKFL